MESCKHGTPKMRFCFQCQREKDPEFDREAVIKKLRARVAELEADTGALSLVIEQQDRTLSRYREALEKLARLGNGGHYGNSIGNEIAIRAITPDPQP